MKQAVKKWLKAVKIATRSTPGNLSKGRAKLKFNPPHFTSQMLAVCPRLQLLTTII
jgi:hypothetical protein